VVWCVRGMCMVWCAGVCVAQHIINKELLCVSVCVCV